MTSGAPHIEGILDWEMGNGKGEVALWFKTAKNRDFSTGPLTRLFTRSLAPLTHSRARGKENEKMSKIDLVLSHCVLVSVEVTAN